MRLRSFLVLLSIPLLVVACGGGGGSAANPPAPPPPALHTALVERLVGTDTYSVYRVKEDGSGWAPITPAGTSARYLGSTSDRVIYLESTSSRIKSIRWDGTGDTILATGLIDVQYRGLLGSRVIYSGRTGLFDSESYTLYSVNIDGTGNVELGPTGTKKVFQALAAGKVFFQRSMGGTDSDVYVVEADGSSPHNLSGASISADRFGCVDGGKLYYIQETTAGSRARGIWSRNLDGSGGDTMVYTGPVIYNIHGIINGRVIASYQGVSGETFIATATTDGLSATDISAAFGVSATFRGFAGNRVIYERPYSDITFETNVWACEADGSGQVALAPTTQFESVEAIQGNRIYLRVRVLVGAQPDLKVVQADGTGIHTLASTPDPEDFLTEVGTQQLAYLRETGGVSHIYLVNQDGTGTLQLTSAPETDLLVQLASGRFYFSRGTLGGATARAMVQSPTAGSVATPLSDGTGFDRVVAVY